MTSANRMTWGRGFFRLWAVCAAIWVLLVAGLISQNTDTMTALFGPASTAGVVPSVPVPDPAYSTPSQLSFWSNKAPIQRTGKLVHLQIEDQTVQVDSSFLSLTSEEQGNEVDRIAAAIGIKPPAVPAPLTKWNAIGQILALAVVPPVLVLILGWVIGWTLAGFRRSD